MMKKEEESLKQCNRQSETIRKLQLPPSPSTPQCAIKQVQLVIEDQSHHIINDQSHRIISDQSHRITIDHQLNPSQLPVRMISCS